MYRHFFIQLFSIFIIVFIVKAADVTSDTTISTTVTAQQHIKTNSDITLSITNGGTISRSNYAIKVNAKVLWLQLDISNEEAKKIVETNDIIYIDNKCTNCLLYTSPSPRD